MRLRTPGRVFIPIIMISVVGIIMMVTPVSFESKPGFFGFLDNTWRHFNETFSNGFAIAIAVIAFVMLLIVNRINKLVENEKFKRLSPEEQEKYIELSKVNYFKRLINSAKYRQTDAEEEAMIIDHGFDGIKELDNSLPQWWVALFHMGNVFMVVYMLAYIFTDFAHADVEYEKHMAVAEEKVRIWVENNDITIEQAENRFTDQQALANGKQVYENVCATCHTANGGGGIGPNLTDGHWVNQTQDDLFLNIYDIIYNGSPQDPQMRPFGANNELTGLTIQDVASYVYYLNQEAPEVTTDMGGAAPQGELVAEWARK